MAREQEFHGTPPDVKAGDRVLCQDANDGWVPMVATGPPRYDHANAVRGRVWLTVPVATAAHYASWSVDAPSVNWPAEYVRPVSGEEQNDD